jgi:hypothetical protein
VDSVYVASEAESLMYGVFRDEGTVEFTTEMTRESTTNPLTWEFM